MTAKKTITARAIHTKADFCDAVTNITAEFLPIMGEEFMSALIHDFPISEDEEGNAVSPFGFEEVTDPAGNVTGYRATLDPDFTLGTIILQPRYSGRVYQPDAQTAPVAVPDYIFLRHMPGEKILATDARLTDWRSKIFDAAVKTAARRANTRWMDDAEKHPLAQDPVALLLSTFRSAKDDSWKRAHPLARDLLAMLGNRHAERLSAVGETAKARQVKLAFDKRHFTASALQSAFSSKDAAAVLFPALPDKVFTAVLDAIIAACPTAQVRKRITDEEGNPIKDDEGRMQFQEVIKPISPVLFNRWKETRHETPFTGSTEIDLSDMAFTL